MHRCVVRALDTRAARRGCGDVPVTRVALNTLAKLSPDTLMLMKGHLSAKSLAAIAVFTSCLPGPSLAATKWARCTPYPKGVDITVVYDVELKTDSEKISLIRDVRVNKIRPSDSIYVESSNSEIISPARWFPTEVVVGPIDFTYLGTDDWRIQTSKDFIKISRQDLSYATASEIGGEVHWYENYGSCKIIPNPVKTLF